MTRFSAVVFIIGIGLGVGVAYAAELAVVVDTITYVAGESRPITMNTDGQLRVTCS